MNIYDELYVVAEIVRGQERQCIKLEALEDKDDNIIHSQSDSELSVLASSLFNNINSIKSSEGISVKLGDVEISRTDQVKTKTGPWRTRSRKIVKYRDPEL